MTILEFNEEQQGFHYNEIVNDVPQREENTFGWKTLLVCKNDIDASSFADFLQRQFIERGKGTFDELKFTVDNLAGFVGYRDSYAKQI